ncbi:MAG TPA: helix-turn-helix transcriptional regulator [bacterium]|nr:helix-turn-helix transcriptional regulator [bacterium]
MRVRLRRAAVEVAIARRNLTKTALARKTGLHRTHLSDLLAGRTYPGPKTRQRLLEVLGGTFDEFFEIVDPARRRRRLRDLVDLC